MKPENGYQYELTLSVRFKPTEAPIYKKFLNIYYLAGTETVEEAIFYKFKIYCTEGCLIDILHGEFKGAHKFFHRHTLSGYSSKKIGKIVDCSPSNRIEYRCLQQRERGEWESLQG